jgi:hypothetical protein
MRRRAAFVRASTLFSLAALGVFVAAQRSVGQGIAQGPAPQPTAKSIRRKGRNIPQLEDITQKASINLSHSSSPESRYIIESTALPCFHLNFPNELDKG